VIAWPAVKITLPIVFLLVFTASAFAERLADHVLVISVDGLRPDALTKADAPVMQGLIPQGAATLKAQTILPSLTLPSHTSMLTGVNVDKHGITCNSYKPENGLVRVPTMFEVARKCGHTTALFAGKEKFKHLERPGSLDIFSIPAYDAMKVAAAAAAHIVTNKPRLTFVHLANVDGIGHTLGWMSPFQIRAVGHCDRAVGRLLEALDAAGIRQRTAVLVTADHGGHLWTHGSDRPEDMTIPWIAVGAGIRPGLAITKRVTTYDTAATALKLLGVQIPQEWDGKPVSSALTSTEVATLLVEP
jgi:predicted AlkP superfamily pyrophosphatase or phosphodiesterase